MKRREFVKRSIGAGIITSAVFRPGPFGELFGQEASSMEDFDLVAVKGGEPGAMFDRGIQSLGGMKTFVKKGQKVVIKPNIGWDTTPERAANTNPQLVGRIIEHCLAAGAKSVYVFDHTINEWTRCYKNSGIENATKNAGGKIVAGNSQGKYHEIEVPDGIKLKKVYVHELVLEADVFINVPVLKHHGGAGLCVSMKNLMGAIWDRKYWHQNDLNQCIADFTTAIKPTLNIVDGYNVLMKNGPRGVSLADVEKRKFQLISTNMVAIDAAATKMLSKDPRSIGHIKAAEDMGLGTSDLSKMNINRIQI